MDKRLVVVVDSWEPDSSHPCGHYVRTLGVIGDKNTETVSVIEGRRGACVLVAVRQSSLRCAGVCTRCCICAC
jgi:hypothetical protein